MELPGDAHTRKLCCVFRLADALDVDARRGAHNDAGTAFEDIDLPEREIPFWTGHRAIAAYRLIRCGERLTFEFLSTDMEEAAGKLEEVNRDLSAMDGYANWDVRQVLCPSPAPITLPPLPPPVPPARRGYWAYSLTPESRARVLQVFPPHFAQELARHITIRFGVFEDANLPPAPTSAQVIGYVTDGEGVEALIISVDGTENRPAFDPGVFHLTLSLAPGRQPKESNLVIQQYARTVVDPPLPLDVIVRWLEFGEK